MTITQQISIDLQQPGNAPIVHAVQGEEYTREVEVTLYSGGVAWTPPSGCKVAIRYGKPDGKGGIYDKLPDNTTAWSILNNTISITLAPQMLTVAGIVNAQAEIIVNEKEILSTFHFIVDVEEDASMGAVNSENYINWKSFWFPQTTGAKVGQYVKVTKVDSEGHVIAVSTTNEPNETNQIATTAKSTAENATTLARQAQSTANSALAKANAALPADSLPDVINDALAQAKESGEFDGEDGKNGSNGLSVLAVNITAGDAQKIEVYPDNVIENEGALFPRAILVGDKILTEDGKIFIVTSFGTKFDATTGSNITYYSAKFLINAGGSVKSVNGVMPDENGNVEIKIPEKSEGTEIFDEVDLPKNPQYFGTLSGVRYYYYLADETNFTWNNPQKKQGPVTITATGMLRGGGKGNTKLKTVYEDGTYGPEILIVVDGVSKISTVTTDANKMLAKITGDSEYGDWVMLDMSVMSVVLHDYVPTVTIDNTLTKSGQAADAKAVGDALAELEKKIPKQPADAELFDKADLPLDNQSFVTMDGVEYYRYHAGATNFEWVNPRPGKGSVTITARGVPQYSGTGSSYLNTYYDDGTSGPRLLIIKGGESQTVTVTTDENKTLARITGNYDLENWVLLDMSVMSVNADYLVQEEYILPVATADKLGGIKADPKTDADTQPVRISVDGKLYTAPGGEAGASGKWVKCRCFTVPTAANVESDTSGISWLTDENNNVYGFEIDTDEAGNAFSYKNLFMKFRQGESAGANKSADFYINDVKIGAWPSAQINLINRTGKVRITRMGYGYELDYAGLNAFTSANQWTNAAALSNGDNFSFGIDAKIDEDIRKVKMVFSPENHFNGGYNVGIWGEV